MEVREPEAGDGEVSEQQCNCNAMHGHDLRRNLSLSTICACQFQFKSIFFQENQDREEM